jgi:hypothetical protein
LPVFEDKLCHEFRNTVRRYKGYLEAGGWHFETQYEISYVEMKGKN